MAKYRQKIKAEVMVGSRGSTYPTLKRLGARPFEKTGADFQILSHATQGLTPQQSVEVIAAHFISQKLAKNILLYRYHPFHPIYKVL